MSSQQSVAAVVVTYNRRPLLEHCLQALLAQSRPLDGLIVVDNLSTDGTVDWLQRWLPLNAPLARALYLGENSGGAGGFSAGLKEAVAQGFDWIWMMDDDARPHLDALEKLLDVSDDTANIYGSLAVSGDRTSWETSLLSESNRVVSTAADVPRLASVHALPFLGFMIHRSQVERIGFPDASYFIAADDVEYSIRARQAGSEVLIAGESKIEHPESDRYQANLGLFKVTCLRLAPWKRYYDTRNRLLIARQYYGMRLFTEAIPGSFVRLVAALLYEPRKLAQLWAFTAGLVDGLLGRKGRRHEAWGIRP